MPSFRLKSVQLDLFGPSDDGRPRNTPQWRSLPDRTRQQATVLMTRMLLEHLGSQGGEAEAGTGEESSDV